MSRHKIGLIEPPNVRNAAISEDELRDGYEIIQRLSKHHRLKLGEIKGKATQSYTRSLSTKTIMAVDEMLGRDSMTRSVEGYNAATQRSADLFGIIDAISIDATNRRTRYIQACGKSDWQQHVTKLSESPAIENVRRILAIDSNTLELWGWQSHAIFLKGGGRGKQVFWYPRVQIITMDFMLGKAPPTFVRFWEA
jgi:hypothetical protein